MATIVSFFSVCMYVAGSVQERAKKKNEVIEFR